MPSHLETLGVSHELIRDAVDEHRLKKLLHAVYQTHASFIHPDKNPQDANAVEKMKQLNEAWHIIQAKALKQLKQMAKKETGRPGLALLHQIQVQEIRSQKHTIDLLSKKIRQLTTENGRLRKENQRLISEYIPQKG